MPSRVKLTLRPEHDFAVAGLLGESYALGYQTFSDSKPPRISLDEQQAQLCDPRRFLDKEDCADACAVPFGNPAPLQFRVKVLDKFGNDFCDECLEAFIVFVFLPIKFSMALYDPAHVSGAARAEGIGFVLRLDQGDYSSIWLVNNS